MTKNFHGDLDPVVAVSVGLRDHKGPPTIDDLDAAGPPDVEYQDWDDKTTRVVSGPIGTVSQYPGTRFLSHREAKAHWTEKAGRIIADESFTGRWIFRIPRTP